MHLGALSQASSISNYMSVGPLIFNGGSLSVSGRRIHRPACRMGLDGGGHSRPQGRLHSFGQSRCDGERNRYSGRDVREVQYRHNLFELSQAATETGTNTLTFGVVSGSCSYQTFERIQMNTGGTLQVWNNGGTLTRVEAGDLTGGAVTLTKSGDGTLAVAGGNAFGGTLYLNGGTFELDAKDGVQPALSNVSMTARTVFSVPDTATTATLYSVSGSGEFVKSGGGEAVLKYTSGTNTQITVLDGTLTVTPPAAPETAPVGGAWFHVDASDPASLTVVSENGTNFVTQWNDTRTNGVCALSQSGAARPFLRENFQNGMPWVDFGSFRYSSLSINGYGGYLNWNTECTTLREAFSYSATRRIARTFPFGELVVSVGAGSTYQFHRGFNGALFLTFASANLYNGTIGIDETTVSVFNDIAFGLPCGQFVDTGTGDRFNFCA
jgi:autotransporter-associated beta strand protein